MSADFATMQLAGRMTGDPKEFKVGDNAKVVFSVAINRNVKKGDDFVKKTTFVDCVAWGNPGKHVLEHGKKGATVSLTGNWEDDRFTDKEDKEVVRHQINVQNVKVFSVRDESAPAQQETKPAPKGKAKPKVASDEEIPF